MEVLTLLHKHAQRLEGADPIYITWYDARGRIVNANINSLRWHDLTLNRIKTEDHTIYNHPRYVQPELVQECIDRVQDDERVFRLRADDGSQWYMNFGKPMTLEPGITACTAINFDELVGVLKAASKAAPVS